MADVNANIGVHIDTSAALAELKALQRQLANFHSSVAKNSAAAAQAQKGLQTNLLNAINATGKFNAQMGLVRSSTESFTHALETNKLSMREYFRYAGGSTRTFGKLFKQEFNTIGKVAEERVKKMQTQYIKMGRDASGAIKSMSITPRTLDMTNYANKTAVAAQKQAILNQLLKQGSTNLLNFGKNTQWAGRQLMVGFTIPLAYFGTAAAKTFMDLEKQAIRFKRVYGDMFTTTEETNKALADIQQLAESFTKYGVAVAETMEMAANAAAMGKTGADLTAQVAEATRLAVLGGVEQAQALETTISVTNAFGVAAEDLAKKVNFLNAVENQTVVSIEDLTIAIPKAGPVVKQLGGDVEDLAFFLTAMKEGGINASEGANALKSGLASLINPTKKASDMLAGFGINIKAIVESNQGNIKQTVIDFSRALDTLDPLNRARAIEQLFGKFQFSRLSTLFQNVTKDGTQAARVLDLAGASVEELAILSERELGVLENAIGTDFKESIEKLKLAIAPIGKEFLKAITPVAKAIGSFLEKFNNLGDGTKKFIVVATTLVGVIGPVLLMTFGLLANGVANIIKLFITMRSGFLRAGANTNLLAQQTQYLNSEQLEAATVAASLNQAHTRLTQSFNMEATAVRLLRQAYIDATIAATNFAKANPGMMIPGKGGAIGKVPKKFASGTTGLPGPKGAGDIIPILGAPGEAIIPAETSQDPRFKPIIEALVNGKLQGFEAGTVDLGGKSFTTRSQSAARSLQNKIIELKSKGISEEKIIKALETNIERGRPMTASQLERRLSINRGAGSGTSAPAGIRSLAKGSQSAFVKETRAIKEVLKRQGIVLTPQQEKNLFNVQASHIEEVRNAGVKQWNSKNLVADLGYVNNYLNTVKGKLGQNLLGMSDEQLKSMGIDRNELKKLQTGTHPTTASSAQTLKNIAAYDAKINPGSYQAKAVLAGLEYRSKSSFYSKPLQTLADVQAKLKSRVVDGQTSRAKSPALNVVGGASSDVRQIAAGKGESVLNKKTTTALKSGKPVFVPRIGKFGLIGADDGVPKGQTALPPGKAVSTVEQQFRAEQKSLRRQIEKVEQRRLAALKQELKITEDKNKLATQAAPLTKEQLKQQKREVRANRAAAVGRVAGPVAGLAGIGAMAGFMTGNNTLGMGMMGVSALATIAPMLTNPVTAIVAALTAAVAGVYFWNKNLEQSAKKQAEFVKATSGTTQKMAEVGKITGKVGATEIMERRRQRGAFGAYNDVQRAGSMFGDTFLQSDIGKGMAKGFVENMKQFGSKQAASDFALQLSTYVSDGVLTSDQAAGIAEQIGIQLGNTRYTTQIIGDLRSIIGPNGEDLTKDPLRVRTQIITKATQRTQRELTKLSEAQVKGNSGRNEAARIAAISANNLEVIKAQADATDFMYQKQIDSLNKQLEITTNLEKQLQLKQQIADLEADQARDAGVLRQNFASQMDKELKTFSKLQDDVSKASRAREDAYFDSLKSSVKDTYKGTAYEKMATDALSRLAKVSDRGEGQGFKNKKEGQQFEVQMSLLMKNKILNPEQSNAFLDMFAGKLPELQQVLNIGLKTHGPEKTIALLDMLTASGVEKTKAATISAQIIKSNPEQFDKIGEALASLQMLDGHEINMAAFLESDDAFNKLTALANKLAIVEKMPTPITKESILKFYEEGGLIGTGVTKSQLDLLMSKWQDFDALPDTAQKEAISKFITIYETKFADQTSKLDYMRQEAARIASASGGSQITQEAEYNRLMSLAGTDPTRLSSEFVAAQVRAYIGDTGKAASSIPGGGKDGGGGQRDTTLDDLLKKLKMTRDAGIDAEGGIGELNRIFKESGGDITKFTGVIQQLNDMGANLEFVNFIESLDNKTQAAYLNVKELKKGIVELTPVGEKAMQLFSEAGLGGFNEAADTAITAIGKQSASFDRLRAAGVSVADSLEMMQDEQFMYDLQLAKGSIELQDGLIAKYYERINAEQKLLEDTDPEKAFDIQMNKAMKYYDFLEKEAKAAAQPEIDRINDLINANNKLIELKQRDIEMQYDRPIEKFNQDLAIIDKAADEINKKYDKQVEALEKVSSLNEEIANQEKSRLSIASALTSGDIAAAASAVQDARAQAAASQLEKQKTAIEVSRTQEIAGLTVGGKTRAQIEAEIYKLEQARIPILTAIRDLEDQNYNYNYNQLQPLKDALDAKIKNIDASRIAFENQQLAIQKAAFEADKTTERFKLGIDPVKMIKNLWDAITDKNITVTATYTTAGAPLVTSSTYGSAYGAFSELYRSKMYGGKILPMNMGGMVPKYMVAGGGIGSDTVPAMLTPGEFVMNKKATDQFGPMLSMLNESKYPSMIGSSYADKGAGSGSITSVSDNSSNVYNYSVGITVPQSNANPDDIARAVIGQIKYIDNQRIRGQK